MDFFVWTGVHRLRSRGGDTGLRAARSRCGVLRDGSPQGDSRASEILHDGRRCKDGGRPENLREAFRGCGGEDQCGRSVLRAVDVRAKEGLGEADGKNNCRQQPQFGEVERENVQEKELRLARKYVTYEKSCLKELKNTENLTNLAIEHIFDRSPPRKKIIAVNLSGAS